MGNPNAKDEPPEDREAILSRRRFLIESALASAGITIGVAGCGTKKEEVPQVCLSPPPQSQKAPPHICLKVAPQECLKVAPPRLDGGVPRPRVCLSKPPPRACLSIRRKPPKDTKDPAGRICLSEF